MVLLGLEIGGEKCSFITRQFEPVGDDLESNGHKVLVGLASRLI